MMENSVKERLIDFMRVKKISQRKFEMNVGLSNGYLNNLRHTPSAEKLSMILDAYPDLNKVWLLTGEGEMLKPSVKQNADGDNNFQLNGDSNHVESSSAINDFIALLKKKDEQIDRLITMLEKEQDRNKDK